MKKVAILQSNYIPWKGYFDLINRVDEFIIYDEVQYTKSDWRNRNQIKTCRGLEWITIPVFHRLEQKISETRIAKKNWNTKHWQSFVSNYSKANCFDEFETTLKEIYKNCISEFLSEINIYFIKNINLILGINTEITSSAKYDLYGQRTEKLVNICKQANATEYISGPSAKSYIDKALFERENIRLTWMDYTGYPEYNQLHPPFAHDVSIIDLIFNTGSDANKYLHKYNC